MPIVAHNNLPTFERLRQEYPESPYVGEIPKES